ncbi:hypothetical protein Bca52824_076460 [Brassica carinata]|uniref:No apical meristem-associated C-terminal domain-containing protein n=1 Tax=Brassica carinata TaxID=52824 RepID=A0A8X7TZ38_BRACI|nr:hypothetical protein Bca52824_076460 [Brassica carinata]
MKRSASLLVDVLDGDRSLSLCLSSNRKVNRVLYTSIMHVYRWMDQRDITKVHRTKKEISTLKKWCDLTTAKTNGSSKRRKCEDGSHTASSQAIGTETGKDDQVTNRPTGVKAAKARGKRMMVEGKDLAEFQSLWSIKKEDLAMKEKLSKMRLLESLIAKQELDEYEERLEKKLITELLSN